ncbi:integrase [Nitrospira sp.]|nr:integrase [Nitrospira sp.]
MGLTKRKDGWYVEFHVEEREGQLYLAKVGRLKRWKVGRTTRQVAGQQEALIKTELLKGLRSVNPERVPTFRAWAKAYLELETVRRLRSYRDRQQIANRLVDHFGDRVLTEITPQHVEAYRKGRLADGRTVATVNYDHAVLKHMLGIADRRGIIQSNPAKKVSMPTPQNERDRVLRAEEWKQLHAAAPEHLKPVLMTAYYTGMRIGEVLNLTWDRVDASEGFIRLRAEDTKNGEARAVPMSLIPGGKALFAQLAKVRRLDTNNVFLFRGRPIDRVHHAFYTACENAGIRDLRIHDLRHCAATNLRRAGVDTVTAMRIIGHKSERMHRRYNAVEESDLVKAAATLNVYMANTLITPTADTDHSGSVTA